MSISLKFSANGRLNPINSPGLCGVAKSGKAQTPLRWRPWEIEYLHAHAHEGAKRISDRLNRSPHSVEVQASRYGLTLRKRWFCPQCGKQVYSPLSPVTGWCRECSIRESKDKAAIKNREVNKELREEERRIQEAKRARQAIYADTARKKEKLRKLREK